MRGFSVWKSVTLRRTTALVLLSVVLSAFLTMLLYNVLTPRVFATTKLRELLPRARFLANTAARSHATHPEFVTDPALYNLFATQDPWDADTFLLDPMGKILLPIPLEGRASDFDLSALADELVELREGTELAILRRADAAHEFDMLIVAIPILAEGRTVAIVCMLKPLSEIVAALSSLTSTLWVSTLLSMALLIPLCGLAAWHLTRPLHRMRERALRMASGDLRVRADIQTGGEIGELAGALNKLSERLGSTITALMLERNQAIRILNALDEGILAVDEGGLITQINPSLHALLKLRPGDLLPDAISSAFTAALSKNEAQFFQFPYRDIRLDISVLPLSDRGRAVGAVGVFRDGTQAWRLEQTRRDYVANVSHELRTPLTGLRCLLEPLADGLVRDEDKRRELYGTMLRETLRLSRLVDDMLELSRLQSGALALEKLDFELLPVLHALAETFHARAMECQCSLELALPEHVPLCHGNPDRLEQVLVALLDNAFAFTPAGGTVTLGATLEEDLVRVSVADTGPGIAPEDLPHVFERFYKADKAHSGKGTGLGLSIAHELMTRLGEALHADNRMEDGMPRGALFTVSVHLAE